MSTFLSESSLTCILCVFSASSNTVAVVVVPNKKKISVFQVMGLKILGSVCIHIILNKFFSEKNILFYAF